MADVTTDRRATAEQLEAAKAFQYKTSALSMYLNEREGFDPVNDGFHAELFKYSYKTAVLYNNVMTKHNGKPLGIEFKSKSGDRYTMLTPDASEPGRFRASYFDKQGFSSHNVYDTISQAVEEMVRDGYFAESKGILSQLQESPEFEIGNRVSALIGQFNMGKLTHQEFTDQRQAIHDDVRERMDVNGKLHKLIESGANINQLLTAIARHEQTPLLSSIAALLQNKQITASIEFDKSTNPDDDYYGLYKDGKPPQIILKPECGEYLSQVLLHECIHAVTYDAVRSGDKASNIYVKRLSEIKQHARKELMQKGIDPDKYYGLSRESHLEELITEVFTDPELRQVLQQVSSKAAKGTKYQNTIKTMYDEIIQIVNDIIGGEEKHHPVIKELMEIGAGLMIVNNKYTGASTDQKHDDIVEKADKDPQDIIPNVIFGKTGNKAYDFVTVNGNCDLWQIPKDVEKRTAGRFPKAPVRLMVGRHIGIHRGFGVEHIVADHSEDLAVIGMSAEQYVYSILSRASSIRDAGYSKVLYVFAEGSPRGGAALELRLHDGGFYSIRTAFDMKAVGKIVWSGRTASPGVVQEPYTGVSRQSLPKDEPTTSFSVKELPRTARRRETEVSPKPMLEGLDNQTYDNNTPSTLKVNTNYDIIQGATMNMIINDRGETVAAVGNEISIARAKARWPQLIEDTQTLFKAYPRDLETQLINQIAAQNIRNTYEAQAVLDAAILPLIENQRIKEPRIVIDPEKYSAMFDPTKFNIGDPVTFVNDYGVVFEDRKIIGIDKNYGEETRYFMEPHDAPWYSSRERNFTSLTLDQIILEKLEYLFPGVEIDQDKKVDKIMLTDYSKEIGDCKNGSLSTTHTVIIDTHKNNPREVPFHYSVHALNYAQELAQLQTVPADISVKNIKTNHITNSTNIALSPYVIPSKYNQEGVKFTEDTDLLAKLERLFPEDKADQDGQVTIDLVPPNGKDFYERLTIHPINPDDSDILPANSFHIKHFTASPATGNMLSDSEQIKHEFTFSVENGKINPYWMQNDGFYYDLLPPQRTNASDNISPNEIKHNLNQFVSSMIEKTNNMTISERYENAYDKFNAIVFDHKITPKQEAIDIFGQKGIILADAKQQDYVWAHDPYLRTEDVKDLEIRIRKDNYMGDIVHSELHKNVKFDDATTLSEKVLYEYKQSLAKFRTTEQMVVYHYDQADMHNDIAEKAENNNDDIKYNLHTAKAEEHIMKAEAMSGRLPEAEPVLWNSKGQMMQPQLYTFQLPYHEDHCGTYIGHGVIDQNNKFSGKLLPATDPENIIPDSEFTTNPTFALKYLSEPTHTAIKITGLSVTNVAPIVDLQPKTYKFQITGYEESNPNTYMLGLGTIDDQNRFTGTLKRQDYDRELAEPAEFNAKSDPMCAWDSAIYDFHGGSVSVASLPISNITLVQQQEQGKTAIYPSLTESEKQELSSFTAIIKHHYPEAKRETLHQLCTIASDMTKLTAQNVNGTLPDATYNSLTDSKEKEITKLLKDLPGVTAHLSYDQTVPALKLEVPASWKGTVNAIYTVPEIPKNKLNILQEPKTTTLEYIAKKRLCWQQRI